MAGEARRRNAAPSELSRAVRPASAASHDPHDGPGGLWLFARFRTAATHPPAGAHAAADRRTFPDTAAAVGELGAPATGLGRNRRPRSACLARDAGDRPGFNLPLDD